jgi:hypothetical protein
MIFHPLSPSAQKSLEIFEDYYKQSTNCHERLLIEKINYDAYDILLIACDEPVFCDQQQVMTDHNQIMTVWNAWKSICSTAKSQIDLQIKYWQVIEGIGERIPFHILSVGRRVWQFRNSNDKEILFILLSGDEPGGLPIDELSLLSDYWQLKRGFYLLHASGIRHKDKLFLFSGLSGAGKSTIAALSYELGDQVIDQDRILIHPLPGGGYSADGWGYGIVPCHAPLRAIFHLVQDVEDRLIPLSQIQTARRLLERHNDVMGGLLAEDLIKQSFHLASEIARQVPGLELHFRKSPDFWKLIDAQFAD